MPVDYTSCACSYGAGYRKDPCSDLFMGRALRDRGVGGVVSGCAQRLQ